MKIAPLFSVIIPTCNRNELLAKCLDCLDADIQSISSEQYEVIVTDDGHETTAGNIIKENYPWASWIEGPHRGPAANRNNGAMNAAGKWLVFTDDDCLPSSNWLNAYSKAITPSVFVYEGKTTCNLGLNSPLEHAPVNMNGGCLWSCNMMILNSFFKRLGGFDEGFLFPHMEDIEFKDRIVELGASYRFVEHSIVDHPPQRLPWGTKLGATQENLVYYWMKRKEVKNIRHKILWNSVIRLRLDIIFKRRKSIDSFLALISLIVEVTYISIHLNQWLKKYSYLNS